MKYQISAIRREQKMRKAGRPFTITQVKLAGFPDVYELQGFSKYESEKLIAGSELDGYLGERTWSSGSQKTLNCIDAVYVYNLLMSHINEGTEKKVDAAWDKAVDSGPKATMNDGWDAAVPSKPEITPDDTPFGQPGF